MRRSARKGRPTVLEKSRKRGERRWRSFCKFMRRVRSDWNDHGWRRDPLRYVSSYHIDGTTLCNCFFLDSKEAVRFKDTPHQRCDVECDPRRSFHGKESLPIQERRAMLSENDERCSYSNRKRRKGMLRDLRVICRLCGFLLRIEKIEVGDYRSNWEKCDRCNSRGKIIYVNGKPVEYATPA